MPDEVPLHSIRLADWWRTGITMRALCSCGAERQVPIHGLLKVYKDDGRIAEGMLPSIAEKVRCLSCGKRGSVSLRIVRG